MDGRQCTTVESVDAAVSTYWVDGVWRMHAKVDAAASWASFRVSCFYGHIPRCEWPHERWTLSRVRSVLGCMKEGSSPGVRGIPIAVWKSLPDPFLSRVADLLNLIELEGNWPEELLQAYVAMIPKASGGSRPQDQRPITVLDVVYRLWAKGITLSWAPVLQGSYLGPSVMGFRSQASTLHLAQLLNDAILLQRRRKKPLWLVKFDVAKCFPSLPWWALFGIMEEAGIPTGLVQCFRSFYAHLRQRFRYGHVDGAEWLMANGLAQGCPASPDLLNLMFEPFHHWAGAQHVGVELEGAFLASCSFADDVCLLATTQQEVELLVGAYQHWCGLLRIQLHIGKTELWCSTLPAGRKVELQLASGPLVLETRATFRMVGIELSASEQVATTAHLASRLPKAQLAARRLAALSVPAPVAGQLWRTVVLPQLLYGCELRHLTTAHVMPVWAQGKTTLPRLQPLCLSHFAAAEVLSGPPLGACAVRDPRLEMLVRRLRWLQHVGNHSGLVGTYHRFLASPRGGDWEEPSPALRAALNALEWKVQCNPTALCARRWPHLEPELRYTGDVTLTPSEDLAPRDTVWTDGSFTTRGGAAALQWHTRRSVLVTVPQPRSSTHCELVALTLVAQFQPAPALVLTDSLSALQLIASWGRRSLGTILSCPERAAVRQFLSVWHGAAAVPTLEKVKAHDDALAAKGYIKARGNVAVDALAKQAAAGSVWSYSEDMRFADAVQLCSSTGECQLQVGTAVETAWWMSSIREGGVRRTWLSVLYPVGLDFDWQASTVVFRRPAVEEHGFAYAAGPPVLKWVARARSGALNTQARLVTARLATSPRCLCCPAELEDDLHAVLGCPATGSADLALLVLELWAQACGPKRRLPLPSGWVAIHLPQLAVGLLPRSLRGHLPGIETWEVALVLRSFHLSLCERLAEVLRRRERLMDEQRGSSSSSSSTNPATGGLTQSSTRELTVAELRAAEQSAPILPPVDPAQPHSRAFRDLKRNAALSLQTWLKEHPHLQAVPLNQGEPAVALLLLWEADHKQLFPCGKADLRARLNYFSKRLVDAVEADSELSKWLLRGKTRMVLSKGLRPTTHTRWAVRIRPEAGASFLQAWKACLSTMVHRQQHGRLHFSAAAPPTSTPHGPQSVPARARKRARPTTTPPLHTKKARVERLVASQEALAAASRTAGTSSSTSSSPSTSSTLSPTVDDRSFASEAAGSLTLPRGLT